MFLGYVRVSTNEQKNNTSLDDQERIIRSMATVKGVNKFDVCIYRDEGISGALPLDKRPDGRRLWAEMKPGDIVCASKLDRLFRSIRDAINCAHEFKQRGVHLLFCDLNIDTSTAMGDLFFNVIAAFAEFERERIYERTQAGVRAVKARGGHYGGSRPPYGFRIDGDMLVPVQSETVVIDEIMRMHGKGRTNREIIRRLKRAGIRNRQGTYFHCEQVNRIIARKRWPDLGRPAALQNLYAEKRAQREARKVHVKTLRRDLHGAAHVQANL